MRSKIILLFLVFVLAISFMTVLSVDAMASTEMDKDVLFGEDLFKAPDNSFFKYENCGFLRGKVTKIYINAGADSSADIIAGKLLKEAIMICGGIISDSGDAELKIVAEFRGSLVFYADNSVNNMPAHLALVVAADIEIFDVNFAEIRDGVHSVICHNLDCLDSDLTDYVIKKALIDALK